LYKYNQKFLPNQTIYIIIYIAGPDAAVFPGIESTKQL